MSIETHKCSVKREKIAKTDRHMSKQTLECQKRRLSKETHECIVQTEIGTSDEHRVQGGADP